MNLPHPDTNYTLVWQSKTSRNLDFISLIGGCVEYNKLHQHFPIAKRKNFFFRKLLGLFCTCRTRTKWGNHCTCSLRLWKRHSSRIGQMSWWSLVVQIRRLGASFESGRAPCWVWIGGIDTNTWWLIFVYISMFFLYIQMTILRIWSSLLCIRIHCNFVHRRGFNYMSRFQNNHSIYFGIELASRLLWPETWDWDVIFLGAMVMIFFSRKIDR